MPPNVPGNGGKEWARTIAPSSMSRRQTSKVRGSSSRRSVPSHAMSMASTRSSRMRSLRQHGSNVRSSTSLGGFGSSEEEEESAAEEERSPRSQNQCDSTLLCAGHSSSNGPPPWTIFTTIRRKSNANAGAEWSRAAASASTSSHDIHRRPPRSLPVLSPLRFLTARSIPSPALAPSRYTGSCMGSM